MNNLKMFSFVGVLFVCVLFTPCPQKTQKKEVTEQTVTIGATLVEPGETIVVCQPRYAVGKQFGKVNIFYVFVIF